MNKKQELLFFTNLHPLPWQGTRATYNSEETKYLSKHYEIKKLIPVPWFTWLKQVVFSGYRSPENTCIFPFFYIPGTLTSLHPTMMVFSMIISIKPIIWIIKANRVVASWAYAEGVAAAFLKRKSKAKLLIETLGSDVNALMQMPLHRRQMLWAFRTATAVSSKSRALAKEIKNHSPQISPEVIYNGVDFESFSLRQRPLQQTQCTNLLFIGSIIKTKGIEELIDAIGLLKKNSTDVSLKIIGDGILKDRITQRVSAEGLSSIVDIVGPVPHEKLLSYIHSADALILPSYREGVPNVVMESLATGTPVIVTRVGGIPEVVINNLNGIFIKNLDADGLKEAVYDFQAIEWTPQDIRSSVAQYNWANTAEQIHELLEK